ncbi:MAG TPA: alpha/beta hydrolase [Cyclobacteriaceae bacterium]|nr:alpha/beta hydrolase [Cyclobacteriaceae bacterium]
MPHINCNNVSLYYTDEGNGEACILFSHGLLMNSEMFRDQINYFKSRYRCIAYDHRGQGQSEVAESGYDMDTLYLDAAALIEKLQLGAVHFVGLSMGGFIGMRLAARKPELIKSLVLLDTSADAEPNKLKYNALNLIFKVAGVKPIRKNILNIMFGQTFLNDPEKRERLMYWDQHLSQLKKSITRSVRGVIDRQSVYEEIKGIKLRTLVVVGEEDVATVVDKSQRIHKQIDGSVFEIIPHAGHSSSIENPEALNKVLDSFFLHQQDTDNLI